MEIKKNIYYKRLNKLALWPLVGFISLIVVFVIFLVLMLHFKYVPDLLSPIRQSVFAEAITLIASGINKVVMYLGAWVVISMSINVLMIYVVWNVKRLLSDLTR